MCNNEMLPWFFRGLMYSSYAPLYVQLAYVVNTFRGADDKPQQGRDFEYSRLLID